MRERLEKNILWVDSEHIYIWGAHFDSLRKRGLDIVELEEYRRKPIVDRLKDRDAVIIHCGTVFPMIGLKNTLESIRSSYPNIKIGLDTNAIRPDIEDLVDFYITKPIEPDDLFDDLVKALKKP